MAAVRLRRLAAGGIAGQAQGRPLRSGHAQAFRLAAPGAQHQGHHVQPGRAGRAAGAERRTCCSAFGNKEFYKLNGDLYPEGLPLGHVAGRQGLQQGRPPAAKLLDGANVADKKIRILTSQQYEFHYKMALVAAEYQGRRLHGGHAGGGLGHADAAPPGSGRVGHLHHPQRVPARTRPDRLPSKDAPGWWDTPAAPGHGRVQPGAPRKNASSAGPTCSSAVYDEIPFIKVGDFNAQGARSPSLQGTSRRRGRSSGMPGRAPSKQRAGRRPIGRRPPRNAPSFRLDLDTIVLRYLLNRLVGLVAVMFIVATIVFVIIRITPGDPAAVMLGPRPASRTSTRCARSSDWTSPSPCST